MLLHFKLVKPHARFPSAFRHPSLATLEQTSKQLRYLYDRCSQRGEWPVVTGSGEPKKKYCKKRVRQKICNPRQSNKNRNYGECGSCHKSNRRLSAAAAYPTYSNSSNGGRANGMQHTRRPARLPAWPERAQKQREFCTFFNGKMAIKFNINPA